MRTRLLACALTLVLVAAAVGGATFAWFTSTATSTGNLFTAGTLVVSIDEQSDSEWVAFNFENMQPGDTRSGSLTIRNSGSIDMQFRAVVEGTSTHAGTVPVDIAEKINVVATLVEVSGNQRSEELYRGTLAYLIAYPDMMQGWNPNEGWAPGEEPVPFSEGMTATIDFDFDFDISAGNDYQGASWTGLIKVEAAQWTQPLGWGTEKLAWYHGFDVDTTGWHNSIQRVDASNSFDYASGLDALVGNHYARLTGSAWTWWGGPYNERYIAGADGTSHSTMIDIYLDVDWAYGKADRRFCWSVSLAKPGGGHLRDIAFNVGTDPSGQRKFVVSASPNAGRGNSVPSNPGRNPQEITESGWYTFMHTFTEESGLIRITLDLLNANGDTVGSWVIDADPIEEVGFIHYGWFVSPEITGLAFDNVRLIKH